MAHDVLKRLSEIRWGDVFDTPNAGLRNYFKRVVAGQPEEYRTTFFRGQSVSKVLAKWDVQLRNVSKQWPTLYEFESDLRKKVGPMSIMAPLNDRLDSIESYYTSISPAGDKISDEAINSTIAKFGSLRGLDLRDQKHTIEVMKLSTNSGAPYFAKRRSVLEKTIPCSVGWNEDRIIQYLLQHPWYAAAVLGWRGQEGGPSASDVKQRVVWMFPFAVNIEELRLYQPLKEGAQKHGIVPAWIGLDAVDTTMTNLFDTKGKNDLVICTDFSAFDQHYNSNMQRASYDVLDGLINHSNPLNTKWMSDVFPIKYRIPLAINWNQIIEGDHGMGSGSGGTNDDETMGHTALQFEAAQSIGSTLNPNSQCLGDDGCLSAPGLTVDDVLASYTRHGLEMNETKQSSSTTEATYLRRWHHCDYRIDDKCVGVYSTFRALGRLMEQERYYDPKVWGPKMVALRQLSIIENVKYHPMREEFAEFCMKGDRYRLGIDIPGFLSNIERLAKEATDYMPDFLGYTKSESLDSTGIDGWWIVQYLRSKLK